MRAALSGAAAGQRVGQQNGIVHGAVKPRAAAFVVFRQLIGVLLGVGMRHGLLLRRVVHIQLRQPRAHLVREPEAGVLHAQRIPDVRFQVFAESHAGNHLDHRAQHVVAQAILEVLAGIERQRLLRQRVDHRHRVGLSARIKNGLFQRRRVQIVIEAALHGEQMANRQHGVRGVNAAVFQHAQRAEGGQIVGNRVVQPHLALLDQLKRRRAGVQLGGGIQAEHLVPVHGNARLAVAEAGVVTVYFPVITVHGQITARHAHILQGIQIRGQRGEIHKIPSFISAAPIIPDRSAVCNGLLLRNRFFEKTY